MFEIEIQYQTHPLDAKGLISELDDYQQRLYPPESNHLESGFQSNLSFKQPSLQSSYILVNLSLLKLASQRGELDCGGLNYMAIGYGDFTQLIMLMKDGHISLGISHKENPGIVAGLVNAVLKKHEKTWTPSDPWLFT